MRLELLKQRPSKQELFEFYRTVRNKQDAINWHRTYTPWVEEHELLYVVDDYDYDEIENIYQQKYMKSSLSLYRMTEVIPKSLIYRATMPNGFPSAVKTVAFAPISGKGFWNPKDKVRFEIRSNGFLDPYTTRLNFEVECNDLSIDEIRRIDGSAHSFFTEMVIQVRGTIIERMMEYDTISQILHDINWNANDRRIKMNEGHGIFDGTCGEFSNMQNQWFQSANVRGQCNWQGYDPTDSQHVAQVGPQKFASFAMNNNQTSFSTFLSKINATSYNSTDDRNDNYQLVVDNAGVVTTGTQLLTNYRNAISSGAETKKHVVNWVDPTVTNTHTRTAFHFDSWQTDKRETDSLQWTSIHQGKFFKKNKVRWVHEGFEGFIHKTWTGHPKIIQDGYNDSLWTWLELDAAHRPSNKQNQFVAGRIYNLIFAKNCWGTDFILSNDAFPSFTPYNGSNNEEQDMVRASNSCNLSEVYGDGNTLVNFVLNGYYSTIPWTMTERNLHEAYETTVDHIDPTSYDKKVIKKTYCEAGNDKFRYRDVDYLQEGYSQPYNPLYCASSDEPYFAGERIQVKRIVNGQVVSQAGRKYMAFSVPLLSAIFGVLVPQEMYKFIPLGIFEDLVIELEVNPYALFSSGYKTDTIGQNRWTNEILDVNAKTNYMNYQTEQNTRNFSITKIDLVADLMSFTPAIERMVNDQWTSDAGIIFQTYFWALGPQYTFQNTASVGGAHQINLNFNSLKSIIWRFYPLDFENYSFCRKHYAISHNLRMFKFALGQDFLPQDGVRGNAGTPYGTYNERDGSNREFYNHMLDNFGKLHDVRGNMTINPFNWSLNDRCYDPTKKGPYYTAKYMSTGNTQSLKTPLLNDISSFNYSDAYQLINSNSAAMSYIYVWNAHTALQLPGFHETRVVGKCLYAFNTETLTSDFSVLSGLNTYDFKPFNVIFEVDNRTDYHFKRASRLYMFFHYDAVVVMKSGMSPQVIGRA